MQGALSAYRQAQLSGSREGFSTEMGFSKGQGGGLCEVLRSAIQRLHEATLQDFGRFAWIFHALPCQFSMSPSSRCYEMHVHHWHSPNGFRTVQQRVRDPIPLNMDRFSESSPGGGMIYPRCQSAVPMTGNTMLAITFPKGMWVCYHPNLYGKFPGTPIIRLLVHTLAVPPYPALTLLVSRGNVCITPTLVTLPRKQPAKPCTLAPRPINV